jgi:hypothetical protein
MCAQSCAQRLILPCQNLLWLALRMYRLVDFPAPRVLVLITLIVDF